MKILELFKKNAKLTVRYFNEDNTLSSEMILQGDEKELQRIIRDYIERELTPEQLKQRKTRSVKLLKG